MRTIHSSLAIEGNSLSLGEVTAVIEGKMVAGKQTEIKEGFPLFTTSLRNKKSTKLGTKKSTKSS